MPPRNAAPQTGAPRATRLAIPAYVHPSDTSAWSSILDARPSIVVINPGSGPGDIPSDPSYVDLVTRVRAESPSTAVLGYVPIGWGKRDLDDVLADATKHDDWFGVDGIFWDQAPGADAAIDTSAFDRLAALDGFAANGLRRGPGFSAFNPGVPVDRAWIDAIPSAVWVTFEGPETEYPDALHNPLNRYRPDHQWHIVHSAIPHSVVALASSVVPGLGFLFTTLDVPANPYDEFASFAPVG